MKCYVEIKYLLILSHKELNLDHTADNAGSISPLTFFSVNHHFDFIIINTEIIASHTASIYSFIAGVYLWTFWELLEINILILILCKNLLIQYMLRNNNNRKILCFYFPQ